MSGEILISLSIMASSLPQLFIIMMLAAIACILNVRDVIFEAIAILFPDNTELKFSNS